MERSHHNLTVTAGVGVAPPIKCYGFERKGILASGNQEMPPCHTTTNLTKEIYWEEKPRRVVALLGPEAAGK